MKMEEHVKELEEQLKDSFKGQIGNTQEVLKLTKENKELSDKNKELERKCNILQSRLKEYEDILKQKDEEYDKKETFAKVIHGEFEGMKKQIVFLEE